jgi:hypothetical protein
MTAPVKVASDFRICMSPAGATRPALFLLRGCGVGVMVLVVMRTLGFLLLLAVAGCGRQPAKVAEVKEDSIERWDRERAEAPQALRLECSNVVIGLKRIVDFNIDDVENNTALWKATATCEFINKIGGYERTNLSFRFLDGHPVMCKED